jgi:hypothetical protein
MEWIVGDLSFIRYVFFKCMYIQINLKYLPLGLLTICFLRQHVSLNLGLAVGWKALWGLLRPAPLTLWGLPLSHSEACPSHTLRPAPPTLWGLPLPHSEACPSHTLRPAPLTLWGLPPSHTLRPAPLTLFSALRLQSSGTVSGFYVNSGAMISGPQACTASTFPLQLLPKSRPLVHCRRSMKNSELKLHRLLMKALFTSGLGRIITFCVAWLQTVLSLNTRYHHTECLLGSTNAQEEKGQSTLTSIFGKALSPAEWDSLALCKTWEVWVCPLNLRGAQRTPGQGCCGCSPGLRWCLPHYNSSWIQISHTLTIFPTFL